MRSLRYGIVLVLTVLPFLIATVPNAQAQPARGGSGKPAASAKPAPRRASFTPGMWTAARSLYQKNLGKLTRTRGSAQAPRPQLNMSPAGNQPMALPSNQPIRTGRGWSMTATRGERNSVVSSRSYSSGSLSNTSSSVSSNASGSR